MDSALLQQPIQSIIVEEKKSQQEDVGLAELFLQQEEQKEFLHQVQSKQSSSLPTARALFYLTNFSQLSSLCLFGSLAQKPRALSLGMVIK